MKRFIKGLFTNTHDRLREYWRRLMHSPQKKISEGAMEANKLMTSARKDEWRRKEGKK
jgi:hypothetical protein